MAQNGTTKRQGSRFYSAGFLRAVVDLARGIARSRPVCQVLGLGPGSAAVCYLLGCGTVQLIFGFTPM
jgi:hypothetical protein